MNEDDAERLAALPDDELADLYDVVAPGYTAVGVSKSIFLDNMAAKRAYDEAVGPLRDAYETAIARSGDAAVRAAERAYKAALGALSWDNPAIADRLVEEVEQERQEARRAYDAAIETTADQGVITAKRAYDEAVAAATRQFRQSLR